MMKRWLIVIGLSLALVAAGTGCKSKETIQTITDTPASGKASGGEITVPSDLYTISLPEWWRGNYVVTRQQEETGYSLRFEDPVSDQQGYGGWIVTLSVTRDMAVAADTVVGRGVYGGVLVAGDVPYMVCASLPTDVQYAPERKAVYTQMADSLDAVLGSIEPTDKTHTYTRFSGGTGIEPYAHLLADSSAKKDLDGDGVKELLLMNNTTLMVCKSQISGYVLFDAIDFETGTLRLLHTGHTDFPGLAVFTAGGGYDTYQYLTLGRDELSLEKVLRVAYADMSDVDPDYEERSEYSDDPALVKAVEDAYNRALDVEFTPFEK